MASLQRHKAPGASSGIVSSKFISLAGFCHMKEKAGSALAGKLGGRLLIPAAQTDLNHVSELSGFARQVVTFEVPSASKPFHYEQPEMCTLHFILKTNRRTVLILVFQNKSQVI